MSSETIINNSILLALPAAQVLAAKISTSQRYQLFLPHILCDTYYQAPILFMVVLFSKWPLYT